MNVDLTLDAMRFPNLPNFTPDFGTKESGENEGVGTEDMCGNFMLPFSKQRPVSVTETSTTTAVESDCAISVEASGTTLTMGRPSFVGVSAKVYGKFQSGTASVVYNDAAATTKTYTLHPGECLELCALVSGQSGYWGENMARSSSSILLVAAGAFDAAKTVSLPAGYATPYQAIKVVFPTGHAVSSDTAMTLNGIAVVSNQNGTLAPLPRHQITTGIYSVLMANVCLEMYYSSDYDGNGTPAWVVVGNPVVLSSSTYTIYADGQMAGCPSIGSIYVQYPNELSPDKIWFIASWQNISSNYAGAFFRAAGGNAQGFDNQSSAQGDLVKNHAHPMTHKHGMRHRHGLGIQVGSYGGTFGSGIAVEGSSNTGWYEGSTDDYTGSTSDNASGGVENRPTNYTVQIWKRIA